MKVDDFGGRGAILKTKSEMGNFSLLYIGFAGRLKKRPAADRNAQVASGYCYHHEGQESTNRMFNSTVPRYSKIFGYETVESFVGFRVVVEMLRVKMSESVHRGVFFFNIRS